MDLNKVTGLPYRPEDMNMRLAETLVMYRGRPFYIVEYEMAENRISGYYPDNDKVTKFTLPNRNLDIRPPRLGYVNYRGTAIYVSRYPVRRYKQGIHSQNITFNAMADKGRLIRSPEFSKALMGDYPSFNNALRRLESKNSVAFNRHWAVLKAADGIHLMYRGNPVGAYKDSKLKLMEDYQYLKEAMEEAA